MFAYPTVRFVWEGALGGETVFISGSFNRWKELLPLSLDPATGDFTLDCYIQVIAFQINFTLFPAW